MRRKNIIVTVLLLTMLVSGCQSGKKDTQTATIEIEQENTRQEESQGTDLPSTQEQADTSSRDSNPVDTGIELPADFGNMLYSIQALVMQHYMQGYEYYAGEETQADSFWCSLTVLASLIKDRMDSSLRVENGYVYLPETVMNQCVGTLYGAYEMGEFPIPDLDEDNAFAVYDENTDEYGFLLGDSGSVECQITSCIAEGESYELEVNLQDCASQETLEVVRFMIMPNKTEEEDPMFSYAVTAMDVEKGVWDVEESSSEEAEETTEMVVEDPFAGYDSLDEIADQLPDESTEKISMEEAEDMAQSYVGEGSEIIAKEQISMDGYPYFSFTVKTKGGTEKTVLVSTDGESVIGARKNSDGTWTFEE